MPPDPLDIAGRYAQQLPTADKVAPTNLKSYLQPCQVHLASMIDWYDNIVSHVPFMEHFKESAACKHGYDVVYYYQCIFVVFIRSTFGKLQQIMLI